MTIRKHIAGVLALVLLFGMAVGLPEVSYAAGETDYRSELVLDGAVQDTYYAGDEIQLDLQLARTDGGSFGVRLYDNEITVDTSKLEVLMCTAPAISGVNVSINSTYQVNHEAHTQTIKWISMAQSPKTHAGTMALGTIRLRVKANPAEGNALISQNVQGMSDQTGAEITNVGGNGVSLAVTNDLPSYHMGLRVIGEEKASYAAGESFTLQAYITSSSLQFHADLASTTVLLDDERFSVSSATWGEGVTGGYNLTEGSNRKVAMVYTAAGNTLQSEVVLGTIVIQVKEGAEVGSVTLRQQNAAITEGGSVSQKVSAGSLPLTIDEIGAAEMKLTPRGGSQVSVGKSFTLDLTVSMEESYAPQMVHSVLVYDSNQLELVELTPLSEKSSVSEDSDHQIKWVYFDQTPADHTGILTLGSITMKVKETAITGPAVIGLQEYNLVVKNGDGIREITSLRAPDTALEIVDAGVTISGTMSFGAGKVVQLDSLTGSEGLTIDAAASSETMEAYTLSSVKGTDAESNQNYVTFAVTKTGESKAAVSVTVYDTGAEQNGALDGVSLTLKAADLSDQSYSFTLNGVTAGTYKIVTYKKNHTTAAMTGVTVADADIALGQDMVMMVGNVNRDEIIDGDDQLELITALGTTNGDMDLDDNNFVNGDDILLWIANFGIKAISSSF